MYLLPTFNNTITPVQNDSFFLLRKVDIVCFLFFNPEKLKGFRLYWHSNHGDRRGQLSYAYCTCVNLHFLQARQYSFPGFLQVSSH